MESHDKAAQYKQMLTSHSDHPNMSRCSHHTWSTQIWADAHLTQWAHANYKTQKQSLLRQTYYSFLFIYLPLYSVQNIC